jgi:hypothetical protein
MSKNLVAKQVAVPVVGTAYTVKMLAFYDEGRVVGITHDPEALAANIAEALAMKSIHPLAGEVHTLTKQFKLVSDHLGLLTKQIADLGKTPPHRS